MAAVLTGFKFLHKLEDVILDFTTSSEPKNDPKIDEKPKVKAPRTGCRRVPGLLLPSISGLCTTLFVVIVKLLRGRIHPVCLLFWRCAGYTIPILLILGYNATSWGGRRPTFRTLYPKESDWKFLVSTTAYLGVASSIAIVVLLLLYTAQDYITVADTVTISYSGAFFTILLGHCFLGERAGIAQLIISILILCGVGVIARPPILTGQAEYSQDNLIGTLFALGATVMTSICLIMLRKYRHVHYIVTSLFQGVTGIVEAGILSLALGVFALPQTLEDVGLLAALGIVSFGSTVTMTLALKYEPAGIVDLMRSLNVIFSFGLEFILLGVLPDEYSIIGSVIVMSGVLLITARVLLLSMPEDNKYRAWFWLLLK